MAAPRKADGLKIETILTNPGPPTKAWNLRPKRTGQKWRPTAEFAESFLIFFYGATNIFLEHLGSWGKEWSSQDLEHLSITVLFLGGGMVSCWHPLDLHRFCVSVVEEEDAGWRLPSTPLSAGSEWVGEGVLLNTRHTHSLETSQSATGK